jgi:hypothetical protein
VSSTNNIKFLVSITAIPASLCSKIACWRLMLPNCPPSTRDLPHSLPIHPSIKSKKPPIHCKDLTCSSLRILLTQKLVSKIFLCSVMTPPPPSTITKPNSQQIQHWIRTSTSCESIKQKSRRATKRPSTLDKPIGTCPSHDCVACRGESLGPRSPPLPYWKMVWKKGS